MIEAVPVQSLVAAAVGMFGAAVILAVGTFEYWRRRTGLSTDVGTPLRTRWRLGGGAILTALAGVAAYTEHWIVTLWVAFAAGSLMWIAAGRTAE